MDPTQVDSLVQRLVANPHDEEALSHAHQAGAADPRSYALLLERVGAETRDPAYASHWLSEAANVWSTTLGDAHRAARVLMQAIDRDPTQRSAADRLSQLYRDKGDAKALVALLERRAKALASLSGDNPEIRGELAAMHEELGRLWGDSLQQPKKAAENFRRAAELDPSRGQSMSNARETSQPPGQRSDPAPRDGIPNRSDHAPRGADPGGNSPARDAYADEADHERDPQRRLAMLRDQVTMLRASGDLAGATQTLARARQIDERDAALQQEYGALIVERLSAGENVPAQERRMGAELLVGLAEVYDGEHGLAYSAGALDIEPGHDRALQLYAYYARALQREDDVATRYLAYLQVNPGGPMAADARWLLAASYEAAGQTANAIQVLEPLRAMGDAQATAKLRELYAQGGQRMPSVPPAAPPPAGGAGMHRSGVPGDRIQGLLNAAQVLASQGARGEAFHKYREVLESDAAHPEALSWVEDYLRTKRDYGTLRDVLLATVRASGQSVDERKKRLREVAGLCEGTLRDADGAINAWKQLLAIDRGDESGRQSLTRLFERTQRWDDLANLIEQEATVEGDIEKKIALEKKLAMLHENKRRDHAAAAEAWARIADLTPEDDRAIATSSKLFEQARLVDRAAQIIADNLPGILDPLARGALLERLGRLREHLKDPGAAGDAYGAAAEVQKSDKLWEAAERCFVAGGVWDRAAQAAVERAHLASNPKSQAQHFARGAEHFSRAGDEAGMLAALERATDLDPVSDEHAQQLSDRYTASGKWSELVLLLVTRGDRLTDKIKRIAVRRQAAKLYEGQLADAESARETWWKVLEDGDDKEALEHLIDDAVARDEHVEATKLLRRLGKLVVDRAERVRIALREAEILAEGVGDVDAAIARYESVLSDLDPTCRPALQAVADLQEAREHPAAAVGALERELKLVTEANERVQIAWRLARLYEQLDDAKNAIRSLELVRHIDREDFDALARLCELCERTEQWGKTAELLAQRIEVEADELETSVLTRRLAQVLADRLDRGDEALAALAELADMGDDAIRTAYVELGDRLGWRGIVATKLVEWWFEAEQSAERTANLRGAFERFVEVGREQDAVRVACEIVRSKGADLALAEHLERLSIRTRDLDALSVAHDLLVREMTGLLRARELARQAEARVIAGAPRLEAVQHGEAGLTGVSPDEAEELLGRLAAIAQEPSDIVDLYERQITRCRAPVDRVRALARAAQVAASRDQLERARQFFDLALSGTPTEDMLATLEDAAREGDRQTGSEQLRRTLCSALAAGGQGARDGGRTRGGLMRRAASMAHRDLRDLDQAFTWLGDSLIAHVDSAALDALEELAVEVGDHRRAEATLSRALGEVFDGPLVRQLLARRAKLRRETLDDQAGAATDLKRLHELSPGDQAVTDELTELLTQIGDHRAMVQLYDDLILRGKDMTTRAELARKVARMWEEELGDPREAADAWRRVLRLKSGDAEATAGLERAKANMLRKPEPGIDGETSSPPPPPPPSGPLPSPPHAAPLQTAATSPGEERPAGAFADDAPAGERPEGPPADSKAKRRKPKRRSEEPVASAAAGEVAAETKLDEPSGPSEPLSLDLDASTEGAPGEVDVVIADDLAEIVDVDGEEGQKDKPGNGKRSVPPPLPRS
jgi:cellulose synthase operon protein C